MSTHLPNASNPDLDPQHLIPIVVGAHLRAEVGDRPLGNTLHRKILSWRPEDLEGEPLVPLVLTDLWYLNARELMERPTISIGHPEVNAVSAYFANRLPAAFVIQGVLQVQLDVEYITLQACVWGVDRQSTASGVSLFTDRYLEPFLLAAHGLPTESRQSRP